MPAYKVFFGANREIRFYPSLKSARQAALRFSRRGSRGARGEAIVYVGGAPVSAYVDGRRYDDQGWLAQFIPGASGV